MAASPPPSSPSKPPVQTEKEKREFRKAALIAHAIWQREQLNTTLLELHQPAEYARRGWEGIKFVRDHPVLITTVVAVVTRFSIRTLWKLGTLPLKALRMYNFLRLT
ncbi:MAG: YqjK family protein [Candidatus Methylacidiphilales bacterium]|nr:YqjK family protein [Candidatus Methylacidiphilales bacterium]